MNTIRPDLPRIEIDILRKYLSQYFNRPLSDLQSCSMFARDRKFKGVCAHILHGFGKVYLNNDEMREAMEVNTYDMMMPEYVKYARERFGHELTQIEKELKELAN